MIDPQPPYAKGGKTKRDWWGLPTRTQSQKKTPWKGYFEFDLTENIFALIFFALSLRVRLGTYYVYEEIKLQIEMYETYFEHNLNLSHRRVVFNIPL